MYEVEFTVPNGSDLERFLQAAHIDTEGVSDAVGLMNGRVFNCIGEGPVKPNGNRPTYSNGARGPTPNVTPYSPDSIGLTFPAQLTEGGEQEGNRHYLPVEVARLFDKLAKLYGRRSDLAPQAVLQVDVRRLLEQNDPGNEENITDATALYSAIDIYPQVLVIHAAGDSQNYAVTLDVLQRPREVEVENYLPS